MIRTLLIILCLITSLHQSVEAGYKSVIDTEGRVIKILEKVERVIVLTATCIETIYIIGALDKVVGISKNIKDNRLLPVIIPRLKEIPIVPNLQLL